MDIKDIQEILKVIQGTEIEEIELTKGNETIRIKRGLSSAQHSAPNNQRPEPPAVSAGQQPAVPPPQAVPKKEGKEVSVNSPFVGTFYRSSSPGTPPFVEMGTKVKKGQVLCVVEAMKLMNEIEAEFNGTIKSIMKEDGNPVQFGEPLFIVEPSGG